MSSAAALWSPLRAMPLIAIFRGLLPADAVQVGEVLVEQGFCAIEVPLNRPDALQCIEILAKRLPAHVLVGGGTMLTVNDVDQVHAAGGRLMVAPNCDLRVIGRALERGMLAAPGVVTPTEAFAALQSGAHALKLFPASVVGLAGLKALKSVLPAQVDLWPVGGITPDALAPWVAAGATGFGLGGALYAPGMALADVAKTARAYVAAWEALA